MQKLLISKILIIAISSRLKNNLKNWSHLARRYLVFMTILQPNDISLEFKLHYNQTFDTLIECKLKPLDTLEI